MWYCYREKSTSDRLRKMPNFIKLSVTSTLLSFLSQWFNFYFTEIQLREKKQKTLPRSDGCGLNNFDGKWLHFLSSQISLIKHMPSTHFLLKLKTDKINFVSIFNLYVVFPVVKEPLVCVHLCLFFSLESPRYLISKLVHVHGL